MNKFNKRKFALRLFSLPFFFGLHAIFLIYVLLVKCFDFLYYGGETITYNKYINVTTICDTYQIVQKQSLKSEENEQTK